MNEIWLAFITGLTTGGISCLAVQGGLVTSAMTQLKDGKTNRKLYIGSFLLAKILAYTLLGAALGLLGSKLIITPQFQGWMQIAAGIFLLGTAGNLLQLHPFFRYFAIQPPKFLMRIVRKYSKNASYFTPAFLGVLTILIPCGVTQAMMVLAVSSKSILLGAGIMAAFTLGTSPVFFGLGLFATEILKRQALKFVAASAIVFLGVLSINTGQVLRGSAHTFDNYKKAFTGQLQANNVNTEAGQVAITNAQGTQEAAITVTSSGYTSDVKTLKAGVPVKLTLLAKNAGGCSRAFTIPSMNLQKVLPENGNETLEFTPTKKGRLTYTCSMGMYSGYFEVI